MGGYGGVGAGYLREEQRFAGDFARRDALLGSAVAFCGGEEKNWFSCWSKEELDRDLFYCAGFTSVVFHLAIHCWR